MNFLMDRSAENWARELARLKAQTGECETDAPITPTGALAGSFAWTCERGTARGPAAARADQSADHPGAALARSRPRR